MSIFERKARGVHEFKLGGKKRLLRCKVSEIEKLEKLQKKSYPNILQESNFGLTLLIDVLSVGLAHEAGKYDDEVFTRETIQGWVDDCEEVDGISLIELMTGAIQCVLMGVPGGEKALQQQADDDAGEKKEGGDQKNEATKKTVKKK